jgi:hypothetical protein
MLCSHSPIAVFVGRTVCEIVCPGVARYRGDTGVQFVLHLLLIAVGAYVLHGDGEVMATRSGEAPRGLRGWIEKTLGLGG